MIGASFSQSTKSASPRAQGVHEMYETTMVGDNREDILEGLAKTPKVAASELITTGQGAAEATVRLMRDTFAKLAPIDIVTAYLKGKDGFHSRSESFCDKFGDMTIEVMQDGTHLLAVLWESAWAAGGGEGKITKLDALTEDQAKAIYQKRDFLPSCYINEIGVVTVVGLGVPAMFPSNGSRFRGAPSLRAWPGTNWPTRSITNARVGAITDGWSRKSRTTR